MVYEAIQQLSRVKGPNSMQWSGLIGIGIATLLFACCISVLAVFLRWRTYLQIVAAIKGRKHTYISGYQYLCHTSDLISLLLLLSTFIIGLTGSIIASFSFFSSIITSKPLSIIGVLFCIFIAPNLVIPALLYDLLGIVRVDVPALATFHSSEIEPKQALILGLKSCLIGPLYNERRFKIGPSPSLGLLALLETLGLLHCLHLPYLLWLIPLLAACANIYYYTIGSRHIIAWTTRTIQIEQSPWASLVLHIDKWIRLAGVKRQDIRIQTMIRIGSSNGAVSDLFHPVVLLNHTFLAHSDWRQQEALFAWMIRLVHKKFPATYIWLNSCLSVISWTFLAAGVALLITFSPSRLRMLGMISLLLFVTILIYCITLFIAHEMTRHAYAEADQFAADLTGDPLALIVALHTLHALNTSRPQLSAITQKRIAALYCLTRQSDALKRWNYDPVPSLLPFSFEEKLLTTPLLQEEQATLPTADPPNIISLHDYKTKQPIANEVQLLEELPDGECAPE
jgi:hypothetical protein